LEQHGYSGREESNSVDEEEVSLLCGSDSSISSNSLESNDKQLEITHMTVNLPRIIASSG
jgi:hypothetical protein